MTKEVVKEFNGPDTPLASSLYEISQQLKDFLHRKRMFLPAHEQLALRVLLDRTVTTGVMLMCAENSLTNIDGKRLDCILRDISLKLKALQIRSIEEFVTVAKAKVDEIIVAVHKQGYDNQRGLWLSDKEFPRAVADGIDRRVDIEHGAPTSTI